MKSHSPTGQPRLDYINGFFFKIFKEVIIMVDLNPKTIKQLFERQVRELTFRTLLAKEDTFDWQFSGGWLK